MLAIILGLTMSFAHHFRNKLVKNLRAEQNRLLSFSAGVSITYLFLEFLPYFSEGAARLGRNMFFFILLGFVLIHLAEKYIRLHFFRSKLRRELALEKAAVSFTYHFLVGVLLAGFARENPFEALLFFVPVFLHTTFSAVSLDVSKSQLVRLVLASSTFLGVVFSTFVFPEISEFTRFALIGFIIGFFSYTVIRNALPLGRKGAPSYMVVGVLSYVLFLLIIRSFI